MKQPSTLEITTAWYCKNLCAYCPQDKLIQAYKDQYSNLENYLESNINIGMDFNTYKTCINKMPKGSWIDFSGFTEPFQNKNCAEMILYAHNQGFFIRIFTTMVGMTKKDIDRIKHIDFISFVLHLPDDQGLLRFRVDENYCNVFDYLTNKIKIDTSMCFGQLHQDIENIKRKNNLKVSIKKLNEKFIGTRGNNLSKTKRIQLERIIKKEGKIFCKPIYKKNNGSVGRFDHNVLLPNGDVVLCCSDYSLKHNLGNLLNDEYNDLFSSNEYKKIMSGLTDISEDILCRHCEHAIELDI